MLTNARGESLDLIERQALRVATLLSTSAVASRIRRRPWIRGGNGHAAGSRLCLRCTERLSRAPLADCYDFELLHSLCTGSFDPGPGVDGHDLSTGT